MSFRPPRVRAFHIAVVVLQAAMGGSISVAGPPRAAASAAAPSLKTECPAMNRIEGAEALLAQLDRTPARPARVLLRLAPGPTALADVQRALAAVRLSADLVGTGPWLVAELTAAQLRAVLATCAVVGVQRDGAAPAT